jgi:hypothetical protein
MAVRFVLIAFALSLGACSTHKTRNSPYYMESMDQIKTSKFEEHEGRLPPASFPTFRIVKADF